MYREGPSKALAGLRRQNGFTLIELLVVITIIGVLMGLLMPAIQAAREAARRSHCENNLKQIAIGMQNYHSQHNRFPAGSRLHKISTQLGISWRVMLLPFLEENALYQQIEPLPNGGANDWSPLFDYLDEYICPSAQPLDGRADIQKISHYAAVSGTNTSNERIVLEHVSCGDIDTNGIFYPESFTRTAKITDGTSNTLAIGEKTYIFRDWMAGSTWIGSPPKQICTGASQNIHFPINAEHRVFGYYKLDPLAPITERKMLLNELPFGSEHPGGAQFAFADGSVHFLEEEIDFSVYQALATRAGEEPQGFNP